MNKLSGILACLFTIALSVACGALHKEKKEESSAKKAPCTCEACECYEDGSCTCTNCQCEGACCEDGKCDDDTASDSDTQDHGGEGGGCDGGTCKPDHAGVISNSSELSQLALEYYDGGTTVIYP